MTSPALLDDAPSVPADQCAELRAILCRLGRIRDPRDEAITRKIEAGILELILQRKRRELGIV